MNASFESLFIFLLSKLRLPQVYCEPVDGDKSYIARSITLVRHKKRGTALCRLRAASNFQCVGILPYRSLPTKKNPPHPKIASTLWCMRNTGLPQLSEIVKSVSAKLRECAWLFTRARETSVKGSPAASSRARFRSNRRGRDFRYIYIVGAANWRLMGAC